MKTSMDKRHREEFQTLLILLGLLFLVVLMTGCGNRKYESGINGKDGAAGQDGAPGQDGADGQDGAPGSSCSIEQLTNGALITCGATTAFVSNGAEGAPGSPGEACSVQQTVNGAVITCENSTAIVMNGLDGIDGQDGADGQDGTDGVDGAPGQDGADGQDGIAGPQGPQGPAGPTGPATAYSVTELIDPCGNGTGFDEVLLKMANGQIIAHFASGQYQFLTVLTPGNYVTTDQQACNFNVSNTGVVTW